MDLSAVTSFLVQQHTHTFESIKFADKKAGVITAISTAIVAFLFGGLDEAGPQKLTLPWLLPAWAVMAGLCLTFYQDISVIWPRSRQLINTVKGGALSIPERLVELAQSTFLQRINQIIEDELVEELTDLVYQRSVIRDYKFKRLDHAFALSLGVYPFALTLTAAHLIACVDIFYVALLVVPVCYGCLVLWRWRRSSLKTKMSVLAAELGRLRLTFRANAVTLEDDILIGAIAGAELAAKGGDEKKVRAYLRSVGQRTVYVANAKGLSVAAKAIEPLVK